MDKSSLKSSNIQCGFLQLVSCKGKLRNRTHAFMRGTFLPVLIFAGLHGLKALEYADSLVHAVVCSTGIMLLQRIIRQGQPVTAAVENGAPKSIFHTPDEWLVATVEMPGGQYAGTDFRTSLSSKVSIGNLRPWWTSVITWRRRKHGCR